MINFLQNNFLYLMSYDHFRIEAAKKNIEENKLNSY